MTQQKWRSAPNSADDEQLIAEAVAAGRVRRVPMGTSSDWDTKPFKEKRSAVLNKAKAVNALKAKRNS